MGHQTMFLFDIDASKISHLTVNGNENICISDIDFQEIDQNIPLIQNELIKNFFPKNIVQEKADFVLKIALNTWKPPKINVI